MAAQIYVILMGSSLNFVYFFTSIPSTAIMCYLHVDSFCCVSLQLQQSIEGLTRASARLWKVDGVGRPEGREMVGWGKVCLLRNKTNLLGVERLA